MSTKHTPTPWVLEPATEHHGPYITSEWSRDIADLYTMSNPLAASVRNGGESYPIPFEDAAANAEFIVRAVNSHDALVEALGALLDHYTALVNCGDCGNWNPEEEDEVKHARLALLEAAVAA